MFLIVLSGSPGEKLMLGMCMFALGKVFLAEDSNCVRLLSRIAMFSVFRSKQRRTSLVSSDVGVLYLIRWVAWIKFAPG